MRYAVVGAGSIGGFLGARLALSGQSVTFIARGANLDAIHRNGFTLVEEDGTERHAECAAAPIGEAGPHDVVLLAVKAHQMTALAADIPRLFGPDTMVVALQNGIPWWYFHGIETGRAVVSADPDGSIARNIPNDRVIGTVVYPAAELIAPGVVRVIEGNRFSLGEPIGAKTARIEKLSAELTEAGFKAPIAGDLRAEIWLKLLGNLAFNPLSALTHATLGRICREPLTRSLARAMMEEAQSVAEKLGVRMRIPIEKRIAGAEAVGEHKTSMLQDVEAGKKLELEALVGGVLELARQVEVPTPHIDAVYACTHLLSTTLAEQNGKLSIEAVAT